MDGDTDRRADGAVEIEAEVGTLDDRAVRNIGEVEAQVAAPQRQELTKAGHLQVR